MPTFSRKSFLFLSLLLGLTSFSQTFKDDLRIYVNYHNGLVIPEYSNVTYVVNKNTQAFELILVKQSTGKDVWEKLYNYPSYGISAYYSSLGNNEVNGHEFAIYPFALFHYLHTKHFNFNQEIGIGLGYVTKDFNFQTNNENIAVGSHLNMHFNTKFGMHYQLQEKFDLQAGLSFSHFSNANMSEPNLGINTVALYAGIGYLLGKQSEKIPREIEPYTKDHGFNFVYALGGKHTRALQSKLYWTSSISMEYQWYPLRAVHLGIGPDLFFDSSTETEMPSTNPIPYKKYYVLSSGIHLSQEFVYNRISFTVQEGFYVGFSDRINKHPFYNRGIIKYNLSNRYFITLAMKTNLHILDYPELGFGIKWR